MSPELKSSWPGLLGSYDEAWTQLARKHPAYLGDYALGLVPAPFHFRWHDECLDNRRALIFAPIEHGKSTQISTIAPLWLLGHNSDLRLLSISNTGGQAEKWLSVIKTNIEFNSRLHRVFPNLRRERRRGWPQAWHHDKIIVERSRRAALEQKDFSLQAIGYQGKFLGARIDGAILDDVLGPDNTMTQTMRQKVWDWYKQVLVGRVVEGGFIWIIGTAWHEEDLAHQLERELGGGVFHVARYQAGVEPCLWPAQWPAERLEAMRGELGELEFDRQFLNIAFGEATQFIPLARVRECQRLCDDPAEWWEGLDGVARGRFSWITAGVDLGMTRLRGGSQTAVFVLGMDHDGREHVLHVRTGLWIGAPLLREVVDVQRRFGVSEWMFESNAAQIHVAAMMTDEDILRALGLSPAEVAQVCIYAQTTTGYNRDDARWGIRGMGPTFEGLKWRIPSGRPAVEQWIDGLRRYTPFDHPDDTVVASWLAHGRMAGRGARLEFEVRSVAT